MGERTWEARAKQKEDFLKKGELPLRKGGRGNYLERKGPLDRSGKKSPKRKGGEETRREGKVEKEGEERRKGLIRKKDSKRKGRTS